MDYGEQLGIGIDSMVIIPQGYKPLAGGLGRSDHPRRRISLPGPLLLRLLRRELVPGQARGDQLQAADQRLSRFGGQFDTERS